MHERRIIKEDQARDHAAEVLGINEHNLSNAKSLKEKALIYWKSQTVGAKCSLHREIGSWRENFA
jgi:hypothetical protein